MKNEKWDNKSSLGEENYETMDRNQDGRYLGRMLSDFGRTVYWQGFLTQHYAKKWFLDNRMSVPADLVELAD